MPLIVLTTWPTTSPPWVATAAAPTASWLAWRACSAFCLTVAVSSSSEAAVSSRLAACCSVRRDRSSLPVAISPAELLIESDAPWIWRTIVSSCSAVALASSRMRANTPCRSPSMRAVRSPCDNADSSREMRARPSALLSSKVLSCCVSSSKKPCLPSRPMRLSRSPAAAARTIWLTSSSTRISSVRSAHSTTKPWRSDASPMTGLMIRRMVRPPTRICAVCVCCSAASSLAWCSGRLWNTSMLRPSRSSASKPGSSRRRSSCAADSMRASGLLT